MSHTLTVPAPPSVDVAQLRDELTAAGFSPLSGTRRGDSLIIEFAEQPDALRVSEIVAAHEPSEFAEFEQLVVKARRVWNGEDTFTQAQAQKILAGLVLVVARYLR